MKSREQPPLLDLSQVQAKREEIGIFALPDSRQTERFIVQLEYDAEPPIYVVLGRRELGHYARALTKCWSLLGLHSGDRVAIFDFGTSPLTYLASSLYTSYLDRGAADWLGCVPICNDGVAQMSRRAVDIVRFVRPRLMFIRADCIHPFIQAVNQQGLRLKEYIGGLVVAENEGVTLRDTHQNYEATLGVPVYRLLRADATLFLGVECPQCHLLHSWNSHYQIEVLDEATMEPVATGQRGWLVITNRSLTGSSAPFRYLSSVRGALAPPGCPRGEKDWRIQLW